ncbi:unnamed protein product [Amoebophrya sp. A25]|nr:unnamed protein product [Amoebophrya sp. A25]|eukprot:GSA25T00008670001.1
MTWRPCWFICRRTFRRVKPRQGRPSGRTSGNQQKVLRQKIEMLSEKIRDDTKILVDSYAINLLAEDGTTPPLFRQQFAKVSQGEVVSTTKLDPRLQTMKCMCRVVEASVHVQGGGGLSSEV